MTDYADLKALAEAASKGPWMHGYDDGSGKADNAREGGSIVSYAEEDMGIERHVVVMGGNHDGMRVGAIAWINAEYIAAASPDVILALIAENERLREQLAEAERGIENLLGWFNATCIALYGKPDPSIAEWRPQDLPEKAALLRERAEAAEAQLAEMREALKPFAHAPVGSFTTADFERVRAALASPVSREAKPPLTVEDE